MLISIYSCADSCAERGCHVYGDAIGWCIHSYSSTVDGGKVSSSLRKKKNASVKCDRFSAMKVSNLHEGQHCLVCSHPILLVPSEIVITLSPLNF